MKAIVSTLFIILSAYLGADASVLRIQDETYKPCLFDSTSIYKKLDIDKATKSVHNCFKPIDFPQPDIYSLPYSMTARHENWGRLAANTGLLFGGGITALAILQMLPEDATAWNKEAITSVPLFQRWVNHVKAGPVIDKDNPIFNFALHPYAGASYYMSARSQGFNILGSFLYSAFISTVFWEYGIEAFMEIPSIQDLIITPVCGAIVGEGFYRVKRWIVDNGYEVLGSRAIGYVLAFIVDPVNEFMGYFRGNPAHQIAKDYKRPDVDYYPWVQNSIYGTQYGVSVRFHF